MRTRLGVTSAMTLRKRLPLSLPAPHPVHAPAGQRYIFPGIAARTLRLKEIPFPAQLHILVALQRQLEHSGFIFVRNWHPKLCRMQGWDCAERVELHILVRCLNEEFRTVLAVSGRNSAPDAFHPLCKELVGIRHAAVHRRPQQRRDLFRKFAVAAEFTADWLGDRASSRQIQLCRFRLESLVDGFHASRCRLQVHVAARIGQYHARDPDRQAQQQRLREAARRINQQYTHHFVAQVEQVLSESFRCLSSWRPGRDSPPRL
ncbi:hypothetical protein BDV33DRAFT_185897 [Aspergillus novoparasiticus]|uniref:Uncharacterized protein n=1 Tax=Aspergillus novoparasiticus TaxID=986946 RepID=A0A5N6E923_9EURO|nr:hypothetical protein BDV33DRAFT_185897 [Aspergillus novoparasiticus]